VPVARYSSDGSWGMLLSSRKSEGQLHFIRTTTGAKMTCPSEGIDCHFLCRFRSFNAELNGAITKRTGIQPGLERMLKGVRYLR
jgi:hypothetical protein